jgi:hypothetical protein
MTDEAARRLPGATGFCVWPIGTPGAPANGGVKLINPESFYGSPALARRIDRLSGPTSRFTTWVGRVLAAWRRCWYAGRGRTVWATC